MASICSVTAALSTSHSSVSRRLPAALATAWWKADVGLGGLPRIYGRLGLVEQAPQAGEVVVAAPRRGQADPYSSGTARSASTSARLEAEARRISTASSSLDART
ncbi:hypothetical protein [Nocardia transvalensis]|uniref:hypothetical protein n=1 Tax=Nocardia transvalensis TaxID=37333 RepID=UPI001E441388|nr:hypothetical protein [Nocardia transvalensis]